MRLIDADALDWEHIEHEHGARHEAVVDCEQMVEKAPTIDLVRHGRWIEGKLPFYRWGGEKIGEKSTWKCSLCHDVGFWGYNYCPNCGAKMDGENNETD